ncbi:MAG TPA: thiamine pyrophosphate-dependent enzyme [Terracidiphilus sp.]
MAKILNTKSLHRTKPVKAPSLISEEKLIAIYTLMLKCRMLQQRAAALFQQGRLDTDLHASSGREACAVAVGVDLQPEDTVSIAPGDWLPAFVKGLPAEALFRVLGPRTDRNATTVSSEAQKRNILVDLNSADQSAIIQSRAETLRASKQPSIVAAFLPPVSGRSNHWQKVVAAAAEKKLPIVFVQQGSEDRPSQSARSSIKTPPALFHGVPTIAVDAADPVALYRVAYEAIIRARQGRGASMLECAAIPIIHSPDPVKNQPVQPADSVSIMETYLKRKEIQPEHYNREVLAEFTHDLDLATRFLVS